MNDITALGVASLAFVVVFTLYASTRSAGHGQSPASAIREAWTNIAIGFAVSYAANDVLLPLLGAHFTAGDNFWIGWVYTAISIIRQYAIRRFFNSKLHQAAKVK